MNNSYRSGSQRRSRRRPVGRTHKPLRGGRGPRHSRRPRQSEGESKGRRFGKYISPDKFINKTPTTRTEETFTPVHTFDDFGFVPELVQNLKKKNYVHPTRIQDEAIPYILGGRNVVGLANTGSGKTAAFVLPIVHRLKTQKSKDTVLIITPTRELAGQIKDEFQTFTAGMGLYATLCVGGVNIRPQIRDISRNPHVVIGTPGRLKDLFNQRVLKLGATKVVVLDEADRMLDMGFQKDIEFLLSKLPVERQSLYFSATISPEIRSLIERSVPNPITVSVRTSETGEHIAQDIVRVRSKEEKFTELTKMLSQSHFGKVLIFGEMKHSVQKLAQMLSKAGFPAEAIHGNKTQPQRQRALDAFKKGRVNILVATDVAARGLDIPDVTHVINFDQPHTHEDYIHRIGRTGRAGKGGQAYTFVH